MEKTAFNRDNSQIQTVGERLRQLREGVGLTQEKLSENLGVSYNYYGQVERGCKGLSKQLASKLAAYYDETLDYLYYGKSILHENPEFGNKVDLLRCIENCSEEDCTMLLPIVKTLREFIWDCRGQTQKQEKE